MTRPRITLAFPEGLAKRTEQGKLRVHVGEALPLEEAARAHQMLTEGGRAGKIVLSVSGR